MIASLPRRALRGHAMGDLQAVPADRIPDFVGAFVGMGGQRFGFDEGRDRFFFKYFAATLDDEWKDVSFAVVEDAELLAAVSCGAASGEITWFGFPVQIRTRQGLDEARARRTIRLALEFLEEAARSSGVAKVLLDGGSATGALDVTGRLALSSKGEPRIRCLAVVDLAQSEDEIRRGLRKSYRSLVNWGRKNIGLRYVNAEDPDFAAFRSYQEFHHRVAGRQTRPQSSWDAMFEWLKAGGGELSLGYDPGGRLLSATLVIDGRYQAEYSSAVYDREQFDKPIAHWPLFDAILRARQRGKARFLLGEIPAAASVSSKEFDIGLFKRGFTDRIEVAVAWSLPVSHARSPGSV